MADDVAYPLTTTLNRIWAQSPCDSGKARALAAAGKTAPDDEPITFAQIVEAVGLEEALWCCHAEPQYFREWRLFAIWCARQVQPLMTDPRSVEALTVAEKYAAGEATKDQLAASRAAAYAAAGDAPWAAARGAAKSAFRDAQKVAFLQLVTTGTLPLPQQEITND